MTQQLKSTFKGGKKARIIPIKVSEYEYDMIRAKSMRHADGNMSAWIRYVALNYEPSSDELIDVATEVAARSFD